MGRVWKLSASNLCPKLQSCWWGCLKARCSNAAPDRLQGYVRQVSALQFEGAGDLVSGGKLSTLVHANLLLLIV